jgi:tRNA (guanosine-2'-O-)-methyltransferase
VSAILRTADAVGVDKVFLIYNSNKFPKIGKVSSASAKKWITLFRFNNAADCFLELKKEKYNIYSTHINSNGNNSSIFELDFTKKIAIVLGNEHEGVSDDVKNLADGNLIIPMYGMIQSLNVSVSAAVCLYEALRQRELKSMYKKSKYSKKELNEKLKDYISR